MSVGSNDDHRPLPLTRNASIRFATPEQIDCGEDVVRVALPTTHGTGTFLLSRTRLETLRRCLAAELHRVGGAPAGTAALGFAARAVTSDPTVETTEHGHQVRLGLPTTDGTCWFLLSQENAERIVWFLDHMARLEARPEKGTE